MKTSEISSNELKKRTKKTKKSKQRKIIGRIWGLSVVLKREKQGLL